MTMGADRLREILYHLEAAYELIEISGIDDDNQAMRRMENGVGNYITLVTGTLNQREKEKMYEYMQSARIAAPAAESERE